MKLIQKFLNFNTRGQLLLGFYLRKIINKIPKYTRDEKIGWVILIIVSILLFFVIFFLDKYI